MVAAYLGDTPGENDIYVFFFVITRLNSDFPVQCRHLIPAINASASQA